MVTGGEGGKESGNMGWGQGEGTKLLRVRWTQRYTVQHEKYSQYFVITVNGK